jgi:hypothetical protein
MVPTEEGTLVIADISGYTGFVFEDPIAIEHSSGILSELIETFFYWDVPSDKEGAVAQMGEQFHVMHSQNLDAMLAEAAAAGAAPAREA